MKSGGDCGLKPETFHLVSRFADKKESVRTLNSLSARRFDGSENAGQLEGKMHFYWLELTYSPRALAPAASAKR